MLVYENRTLDVTLAKLSYGECQMYRNRKFKGLQNLRNLQYLDETLLSLCVSSFVTVMLILCYFPARIV